MDTLKRKAMEGALVPTKKLKTDMQLMQSNRPRVSNLLAPIMQLSGHEGAVYCSKFSTTGQFLVSSGFDRSIFVWSTYGDCDNIALMTGHSGAVLDLQFSTDSEYVYTCSTDKMVAKWDMEICQRVKRFKGHQAFVNSVHCARRGPQLLCSGADDSTVKLWDSRQRQAVNTFNSVYQVLAVSFNDTSEQIFSAGIDNEIKVWDLRKNELVYKMRGHTDTVTGMELSADGSYLLTNSMDKTLRIWDVRPFAPPERCVKVLQGHAHSFEKNLLRCAWSPDGLRVTAGSSDGFLYVWDTTSRKILYKLPGHKGSVNEVDFHPHEPIVLSCSSDKQIYLGETE